MMIAYEVYTDSIDSYPYPMNREAAVWAKAHKKDLPLERFHEHFREAPLMSGKSAFC
jgi:hypothetical protein